MPEQIPERSAQIPRDSRQRGGTETSPIQTQPEFIF
jgi:hypothetical protein